MNFDVIEIGHWIKHLRESHGYTQEAFAEKWNISRSHLSKIDLGKRCPSIDLLIEISLFFQVTLDYLILVKKESNTYVKEELKKALRILSEVEANIPFM